VANTCRSKKKKKCQGSIYTIPFYKIGKNKEIELSKQLPLLAIEET
jgi:hypothetical protein